ncbi:MAG: NAD(P)H-dependent glycerol-3-phosphate dehydrogenase [Gammaproteobacteria bacterium]
MTMKTPITVLGAGSWGTALAILLAKNHHAVRLWSHNPAHVAELQSTRRNLKYLPDFTLPDNITFYSDLTAALYQIQDILIVVPSQVFRNLLLELKPLLPDQARIAWGTKGLDPTSHTLLHATAHEILGPHFPLAVISGPSFAHEVAAGLPTAVCVASADQTFAHELSLRLINPSFRAYTTPDITGVEICGVIKNILAIAAGAVDALKLGSNAQSALMTRGLAEMQRLGLALGGAVPTFMGLAGVGDLILTCTDNHSRNRRFGRAIGEEKSKEAALAEIGQVVEGLNNLTTVYQLAHKLGVNMPITEQVYQVIYQNRPLSEAIQELFSRQPKSETD